MPNPANNACAGHIEIWQGIEEHLDRFDLIICDLWGVMHDGISLHSSAAFAIQCARKVGLKTVFLSNAPRPREYVRQHLIQMGLEAHLTDFIVTSGGLARDEVRENFSGSKLYHMGPDSDHNTIEGLPVSLVDHPSKADVILATDLDYSNIDDHRNLLKEAALKNTLFLCANPDRVVHVGNKLFYCAGAVADLYESMGGDVKWYGKPMPGAFTACLSEVGMPNIRKDRVLMIGDSMKTDITGACDTGIKSLLIAGGIHRNELNAIVDQSLSGDSVSVEVFTAMLSENNLSNINVAPTAITSILMP